MKLGTKYLMIRSAEEKTLKDFAEMCGLSDKNYGEIERNEKEPTPKSKEKIEQLITKLGWELLDDGVARREKAFYIFHGENCVEQLLDDVEGTIPKGELLITGADESKTAPDTLKKINIMRRNGLTMRHIICEGDTYLRGSLSEYKAIPKEYFINQPIFIYGEKVAMADDQSATIHVYHNKNISDYFRRQFAKDWKHFPSPTKSTAKDKYDV